jgi:hypothetical protein
LIGNADGGPAALTHHPGCISFRFRWERLFADWAAHRTA